MMHMLKKVAAAVIRRHKSVKVVVACALYNVVQFSYTLVVTDKKKYGGEERIQLKFTHSHRENETKRQHLN